MVEKEKGDKKGIRKKKEASTASKKDPSMSKTNYVCMKEKNKIKKNSFNQMYERKNQN